MGKTIIVRNELMEEASISTRTLKEWDRLQLLKPDGFTKDQIPFYSKDTLERVKHIKGLLELGYGINASFLGVTAIAVAVFFIGIVNTTGKRRFTPKSNQIRCFVTMRTHNHHIINI